MIYEFSVCDWCRQEIKDRSEHYKVLIVPYKSSLYGQDLDKARDICASCAKKHAFLTVLSLPGGLPHAKQ